MPSTRLAYLFQRYFDKTATEAERTEFMSLLQDQSAEPEIKALMEQAWEHFQEMVGSGEPPLFNPLQSEELLRASLGARSTGLGAASGTGQADAVAASATGQAGAAAAPVRRISWGRAIAASVLLLVLGGSVWWWARPVSHHGVAQLAKAGDALPGDKGPGGDKAMLILDDGSRMALDSAHEGALARQGNAQVVKLSGGRLAYYQFPNGTGMPRGTGDESPGAAPKVGNPGAYNTIVTPRGGQYQVVLPDGTKAWLNAASSLRFPTAFTGKDREVELTGEGYFEVAKNKEHPFRVKVNEVNVEVLGTRFDVMAYNDENSINTCLLDGSVRVGRGAQSALLKPGEQARFSREAGDLQVEAVDTEQVVAWKNGLFQFDNIKIEPLLRQVARWYDVQVVYRGDIHSHFSGLISRKATLAQMFKILQSAGGATYRLEGNTLTVVPR